MIFQNIQLYPDLYSFKTIWHSVQQSLGIYSAFKKFHWQPADSYWCDGIPVFLFLSVWPLPLVLCCFSVVCYNEPSVLSDWSGWEMEGELRLLPHPFITPGEKAYLCSAVDLCLSVGKSLGTPSILHLSILLLIHCSLHRWLPSSYAYWLIVLQAFSFAGIPYVEVGWQHSQVKLHTDGLYHWLFSSEHKCWVISLGPGSWLDLSFS